MKRMLGLILVMSIWTAIAGAEEDAVRTITLPRFQPTLPDGPGREAFAVACLSCHSTRYVTTQPPLTAAKWEENVRKMIKTYSAPISEEQVPQIVEYLMTTKERGEPGAWDALVAPPAFTEPARVVEPSKDEKTRAEDLHRGAVLFAQACASCHGPNGTGDGWSAGTQLPRPTDLTAGRFSAAALSAAIQHGVPATAMPAFPTFLEDDVRALVTYTQQLAPDSASGAPSGSADAAAAALFTTNCASCHGDTGAGDGPAAAPLARPPTDFRARQPSPTHAVTVVSEGIPGTAMPGWKSKLSESDRQMLVDYVLGLYAEDNR